MKFLHLNSKLGIFFLIVITSANEAVSSPSIMRRSACRACKRWYNKELEDTNWLTKLNQEFKCPCKVEAGKFSQKPIDNPSDKDWKADPACRGMYLPLCLVFHKGAYGCIRSKGTTSDGARQQCCYKKSGNIIRPGSRGAGTPDRYSSFFKHQSKDVIPYQWCCVWCPASEGYCDFYINGVRKGDASHCPN